MLNFLEFIEKLSELVSFLNDKVLLGGDLKINMLADGISAPGITNPMIFLKFCSIITAPTCAAATCKSAFDNFVVDTGRQIFSAGTICYNISDQCPIY